ncbi:MAG: hypothetical protein Q7U71_09500 [bacterium]|nr:hypothetical protein [bacterium]
MKNKFVTSHKSSFKLPTVGVEKHFSNIDQEYIHITTDKIKLYLMEIMNICKTQNEWKTPLGILATIAATLFTTDFKGILGLNGDIWKALFLFSFILSGIWFVYVIINCIHNRNKTGVDYILDKIKLGQK